MRAAWPAISTGCTRSAWTAQATFTQAKWIPANASRSSSATARSAAAAPARRASADPRRSHLKSYISICTALLSLLTLSAVAAEAPVKILATIAVQGAFADIEPLLLPRAGAPVKIGFAQTSSIVERLMNGEAADLVILTKQAAESLAAKGRV